MSGVGTTKESLSISPSILLSHEMTRTALRLIHGRDLPWGQVDITIEPVRQGRDLICLTDPLGVLGGYVDPVHDEILQSVRIEGHYVGHGWFDLFEAVCELHNYRSLWEPRFVVVKVGDTTRHFSYANEVRGDFYNFEIKEKAE